MDKTELIIGRGKVFFDPVDPDTGLNTGEIYIGNTTTVTIDRTIEYTERRRSFSGLKIKTEKVATADAQMVSFITDNMNLAALGLWMGGDFIGSVLDMDSGRSETFTATPGEFYQLGLDIRPQLGVRNVWALVVLDGSMTPIEGLYIDEDNGRFGIPRGRTDLSGMVMTAQYEIKYSRGVVSVIDRKPIKGALRYVSDNLYGEDRNYYWPSVLLCPKDQLKLKDDGWMTLSFEADVLATPTIYNRGIVGMSPGMIAIVSLGGTLASFPTIEALFNSALNGVV